MSVPAEKADTDALFTLADVDPIGRTEVMIYGPPKSGKTVMAATLPGPHRWLAADGPTCIKSLRWAFQAGKSAIKDMTELKGYVPFEPGVYPDAPEAFNKMCDMVDHWFSPDEVDKWQTLVLDSFTEINEWAINQGLGLNYNLPDPKKPLSGSHGINLKAGLRIVTGIQDYKSAMALIEGFLTETRVACQKHGKNLVVICHEYTETRERDDGTTEFVRYEPLLIGQHRQRLPKSFDDIWYTTVYNGKDYKVMMHGDARHIAGTRWGQIVDREEPADFRTLIDKVKKFHNIK